MTPLINQWSVSNQTSKPSIQGDSVWAGWFIDESGERKKRDKVQSLGGGALTHAYQQVQNALKSHPLRPLSFDLSHDDLIKSTQTQFQKRLALKHIVGAWNTSPWRNAAPLISDNIMACCDTLFHTSTGAKRRCFHYITHNYNSRVLMGHLF